MELALHRGTALLLEINLDFPTGPPAHCAADPKDTSFFGSFEDPECPFVHSTDSWLFVAVYCITAGAGIFSLLHAIHRRQRFRRVAHSLGKADAEAGRLAGGLRVAFGQDMEAQGFASSRLGSVALAALGCSAAVHSPRRAMTRGARAAPRCAQIDAVQHDG